MDFEQDLTSDEQHFLRTLHEAVSGDMGGSVSMFDVGEKVGMDRAASSRTAENLMSWELVEVRTLSGAIGITQAGVDAIGPLAGDETGVAGLGEGPVIDESGRACVDTVTTELKNRIGGLNLGFEAISEMTADLKTIDAQLASPKPKTAILRACFESIKDSMPDAGPNDLTSRIQDLLNA